MGMLKDRRERKERDEDLLRRAPQIDPQLARKIKEVSAGIRDGTIKTISSDELLARRNAGKSRARIFWETLPKTVPQIEYDLKRIVKRIRNKI